MSDKRHDLLTDELIDACHDYDAVRVKKALKKGALVNRANRMGLMPVDVLIDPGAPNLDKAQSKCLSEMLKYQVNLIAKHKGAYSVYERVSMLLPFCARVIIEYHKGVPGAVGKMVSAHQTWWNEIAGEWISAEDAQLLDAQTDNVEAPGDARRL